MDDFWKEKIKYTYTSFSSRLDHLITKRNYESENDELWDKRLQRSKLNTQSAVVSVMIRIVNDSITSDNFVEFAEDKSC